MIQVHHAVYLLFQPRNFIPEHIAVPPWLFPDFGGFPFQEGFIVARFKEQPGDFTLHDGIQLIQRPVFVIAMIRFYHPFHRPRTRVADIIFIPAIVMLDGVPRPAPGAPAKTDKQIF